MEEDEEMDLETLQAQIDMSMSFAHNLVSSWIESNKIDTTSRNHDLEKELKEYMRRPPRLGVGAPIPETNTLSIETARLKGKLRDKGKTKQTEEVLRQSDSDDAEESKTGIIRKRIKLDPFAALSKPGKVSMSNPFATVKRTVKEDVNLETKRSDGRPPKLPVANLDSTLDPSISRSGQSSEPNSKIRLIAATTLSESPDDVVNATELLDAPACGKAPNPNQPLKSTILNLDGPLTSGDEEPKNILLSDGTGRKKRRKRRKKRKDYLD